MSSADLRGIRGWKVQSRANSASCSFSRLASGRTRVRKQAIGEAGAQAKAPMGERPGEGLQGRAVAGAHCVSSSERRSWRSWPSRNNRSAVSRSRSPLLKCWCTMRFVWLGREGANVQVCFSAVLLAPGGPSRCSMKKGTAQAASLQNKKRPPPFTILIAQPPPRSAPSPFLPARPPTHPHPPTEYYRAAPACPCGTPRPRR